MVLRFLHILEKQCNDEQQSKPILKVTFVHRKKINEKAIDVITHFCVNNTAVLLK